MKKHIIASTNPIDGLHTFTKQNLVQLRDTSPLEVPVYFGDDIVGFAKRFGTSKGCMDAEIYWNNQPPFAEDLIHFSIGYQILKEDYSNLRLVNVFVTELNLHAGH